MNLLDIYSKIFALLHKYSDMLICCTLFKLFVDSNIFENMHDRDAWPI